MEKTEKYQAEVERTEENPFETSEQSEGQNLIDEAIEPAIEIIKEALEDDGSHKCDTCSLEFATCESGQVVFGIDIDPNATGKEADRVVTCGAFVAHNLADVVAYSPSPLDRIGKKFTRELPVPVPEDELTKYAQEMARIYGTWVKTKLDAKAFAKSCKNVTDECEERELEIAEIINAGAELRPVTVFWSYDFTHHVKRLVRSDTREVVEEVALVPEDYQTDLPLFDTVEGAEPVEVFQTGTIEGDSGGDEGKTSQIEDLNGLEFDKHLVLSVSQESLDDGWPDPPRELISDEILRGD